MASNPRVLGLLEEMLNSGKTPDEVCRDCPELLAEVEQRWREFQLIDVQLRTLLPGLETRTEAGTTAPPGSVWLEIVRGFAAWLQATDPTTQVPPQRLLPAGQRRPTPHIYSDREIADLMAAAGRLRSASGLRRAAFKTLLGLLAATGLRPGEALALDVGDVDLVGGILAVRRSKFGKSRFVPLDESARAALAAYAEMRDTPAFLVTGRGTRLRPSAARRTFATLCRAVGLRPQLSGRRGGRGPRLQDIRHPFATRRIIEWYRAGLDVDRLMPRLATYLGHVQIAETYWYIQAVPELLRLATERLEAAARGGLR